VPDTGNRGTHRRPTVSYKPLQKTVSPPSPGVGLLAPAEQVVRPGRVAQVGGYGCPATVKASRQPVRKS